MKSQIYVEKIDAWHQRRISSLQNDYGWLTIVGLEWLKEGDNSVANLGTITLQRGKASVQLSSGLSGLIGDKPFSGGAVRTEADPKGPDRVKVGSKAFAVIKRGNRFALRLWDTKVEGRERFVGISRYPVSEKWRIEALWEEYAKPKSIKLPSAVHKYFEEYEVPGVATFNIGGVVAKLEPIVEDASQELFFAFSDNTTGRETYSGGRYLYASPAERGVVVLDFNKAINPPSAFTSFATNPLPPELNRIDIAIEAGERSYPGR